MHSDLLNLIDAVDMTVSVSRRVALPFACSHLFRCELLTALQRALIVQRFQHKSL